MKSQILDLFPCAHLMNTHYMAKSIGMPKDFKPNVFAERLPFSHSSIGVGLDRGQGSGQASQDLPQQASENH